MSIFLDRFEPFETREFASAIQPSIPARCFAPAALSRREMRPTHFDAHSRVVTRTKSTKNSVLGKKHEPLRTLRSRVTLRCRDTRRLPSRAHGEARRAPRRDRGTSPSPLGGLLVDVRLLPEKARLERGRSVPPHPRRAPFSALFPSSFRCSPPETSTFRPSSSCASD